MEGKEKEFFKRLFKAFRAESEERIRTLTIGLLEWESSPDNPSTAVIIDSVYRDVHSLKGASRAVNLHDLENIFMKLEDLFSKYRKKEVQFSKDTFDHLHEIINLIKTYLTSVEPGGETQLPPTIGKVMSLLGESTSDTVLAQSGTPIEVMEKQEKHQKEEEPGSEKLEQTDIRVSRKGLDALLLQSEEFILTRNDFEYWLSGLSQIKNLSDLLMTEEKQNHIESQGNGTLSNSEVLHRKLDTIYQKIQKHYHQYQIDLENMRHMVQDLLLVPFHEVSEFFPKNIRDLATELGKEITYSEHGGEILIDRRILEILREPFLHLIRNSVDHGIEIPQRRQILGKSTLGKISVHIQKVKGQMIEILFTDDGSGFDFDRIRQKLLQKKDRTAEFIKSLSESELLDHMVTEGISSREKVSHISGRGLGLSIIKNKIEQIGGSFNVNSTKDKGTVFSMRLPTEITSYRGLLFTIGERTFAIPSNLLEKVICLQRKDLSWVENHYVFSYQDHMMSVYSLQDILGIKPSGCQNEKEDLYILLLGDEEVLAYLVDKVLSEQDLLARPLDPLSAQSSLLSGVAVIRSDLTVPILNVGEIISRTTHVHNITSLDATFKDRISEKKSILVVEDSITSRMILKNILESEGYLVQIAVDGFEAMIYLKQEKVDLVVSDIEMPKMNGFELTKAIRSSEELSELPLILVTTMDSKEDREKGLLAGADAYIVKSSFDQSNLIDVVRRLLE